MAFFSFLPFNYWTTPLYEFIDESGRSKEYGLDDGEVLLYKHNMEQDRIRWKEKRESFGDSGFYLQLLASALIFIIMLYVKQFFYISFEIEDEDSAGNEILSVLCFVIICFLEWRLWSKDIVVEWFYTWIENKYRVKSQHNYYIEKYLEECHLEWYKKNKPFYDKENRYYEEKYGLNKKKS